MLHRRDNWRPPVADKVEAPTSLPRLLHRQTFSVTFRHETFVYRMVQSDGPQVVHAPYGERAKLSLNARDLVVIGTTIYRVLLSSCGTPHFRLEGQI